MQFSPQQIGSFVAWSIYSSFPYTQELPTCIYISVLVVTFINSDLKDVHQQGEDFQLHNTTADKHCIL